MIRDAQLVPRNSVVETDLCIVGGGAAGITLAREFDGQPFRVCLLESGGVDYELESQALYKGKNIGLPYFGLDESRLRMLGGSTNCWSGTCRPLDEIDFLTRPWVPYSGWPFDKAHLIPYYQRAHPILGLGAYNYDANEWGKVGKSPPFPFVDDQVVNTIFHLSRVRNFGKGYREQHSTSDNITTLLHANVIEIETTENARTVRRVKVACLEGNRFFVSARIFILATGGIENARLLLLSNHIHKGGLGNQNDLVGRFFMEHLTIHPGTVVLSDSFRPIDLYRRRHWIAGEQVMAGVALSRKTQLKEKLGGFCVNLLPPDMEQGLASLKELIESGRQGSVPDDFLEHVANVIADLDDVLASAYGKAVKGRLPVQELKIFTRSEQTPNPESRVTLSSQRDSLGKQQVDLNWRLNPLDEHTIMQGLEILGREIGRAGVGRMQLSMGGEESETDLIQFVEGEYHHMGTTRMHVDPKLGVVDESCQVHGMTNLFIAGSSIFPNVGFSNPTLTIVALALRLADHIKKQMAV